MCNVYSYPKASRSGWRLSCCTIRVVSREATPKGVRYTIRSIRTYTRQLCVTLGTGYLMIISCSPEQLRPRRHRSGAGSRRPEDLPAAYPHPQLWPQPPVLQVQDCNVCQKSKFNLISYLLPIMSVPSVLTMVKSQRAILVVLVMFLGSPPIYTV